MTWILPTNPASGHPCALQPAEGVGIALMNTRSVIHAHRLEAHSTSGSAPAILADRPTTVDVHLGFNPGQRVNVGAVDSARKPSPDERRQLYRRRLPV
jgi:hypothetical protein